MLLNIITRNYIRNLAFKKKNYSAKLFSWRQFIFSIFFKLYINLYKLIIIIIIEYKIKEKKIIIIYEYKIKEKKTHEILRWMKDFKDFFISM